MTELYMEGVGVRMRALFGIKKSIFLCCARKTRRKTVNRTGNGLPWVGCSACSDCAAALLLCLLAAASFWLSV